MNIASSQVLGAAGTRPSRQLVVACGLVLLAGIIARTWGLFSDFWFDEILGLQFVLSAQSPWQILTGIHFDTNHWLYSFFLYACGDRASWIAYRIPAFLASLAALALVLTDRMRTGPEERCIRLVLFSASFLFIVYASEARGYTAVILFALLAHDCMDRYLATPTWGASAGFVAACVMGFLSHLTFLFPFLAFGLWALVRWARHTRNPVILLQHVLRGFLVPGAFITWLYVVDIRFIEHAGSDPVPLFTMVRQLAAQVLGFSDHGWGINVALLLMASTGLLAVWAKARVRDDSWVFLGVVLLAAPAAVVGLNRSTDFQYWCTRHFLVCVPFFLLAAAHLLARLARKGRWGAPACVILLTLYVAGNTVQAITFLRAGRGHYADAVRFMAAETPAHEIVVASDQDIRNRLLLEFYARRFSGGKSFVYCRQRQWPDMEADWFIVHSTERSPDPFPTVTVQDRPYRLVRHFPSSTISGWHWFLYRRVAGN